MGRCEIILAATAAETLRACARVGIDVGGALARFHPAAAPALADGIGPWLDALRGTAGVSELAARVGRSRFAVSRWLSGGAQPRLPDWLRMVDALTRRLSDLVAEIVPIDAIPALAAEHAERDASRRLARDEPWTEAILRVIETGTTDPAGIARSLPIAPADAERCVNKLVAAGIVRDGQVTGTLTVDTRASPVLRRHWAGVALERLDAAPESVLFSYNVVSVSEADLARIEELHRAYFREVRAIVAASEPAEAVVLLNVQLVRFPPALGRASSIDEGRER